jgi:competence protein ComEC
VHPKILIACIVAMAALTVFLAREARLHGNGDLRLLVLDVGQGDSILLITPSGKQILIDGGRDNTALSRLGKAMPFFDRTIELLVLTHPDADHVTALPAVLARYRIERVLMTGVAHDSDIYRAFLEAVRDEGARVLLADPDLDVDMGDGVLLDVVWPRPGLLGRTTKKTNETSIVLRALYGGHSILLTGDIEAEAEAGILASGEHIDSDVLKVAHHGSRTSSMTGFLLATSPELAVISVAAKNPFGHPHPWVTRRLATLGIPVRTTAEEGTVCLVFEAEGDRRDC